MWCCGTIPTFQRSLRPEIGGSMDLRKVGILPQYYTASQTRRRRLLKSPPSKPKNSQQKVKASPFRSTDERSNSYGIRWNLQETARSIGPLLLWHLNNVALHEFREFAQWDGPLTFQIPHNISFPLSVPTSYQTVLSSNTVTCCFSSLKVVKVKVKLSLYLTK